MDLVTSSEDSYGGSYDYFFCCFWPLKLYFVKSLSRYACYYSSVIICSWNYGYC